MSYTLTDLITLFSLERISENFDFVVHAQPLSKIASSQGLGTLFFAE
jgi:hypothetical protein